MVPTYDDSRAKIALWNDPQNNKPACTEIRLWFEHRGVNITLSAVFHTQNQIVEVPVHKVRSNVMANEGA